MLHEMKGLNMLKTVNCTEYLKNKLSIKSIFSWLNGRAVEQLNSSISVKFFNLSTIKLKNLFTTHYSKFTKKVFAFTLAETLIVMGVIGVVAALTLPNLNQSTANKEKVAKVKKIYANLNDAVGRAVAVYGPINEWYVNDKNYNDYRKRTFERITEFMKTSSKATDNRKFVTADGTEVVVDPVGVSNNGGDLILFVVDIDGPNKGPNIMGKDNFVFVMDENNCVIPYGPHSFSSWDQASANERKQGLYAAWWIIDNDNMDYLKCPDKLSETVISCN